MGEVDFGFLDSLIWHFLRGVSSAKFVIARFCDFIKNCKIVAIQNIVILRLSPDKRNISILRFLDTSGLR